MPSAETSRQHVAAVVVANARVSSLEEVLTALREQTRPPDSVLIVDSQATPEVRALLDLAGAADDVGVLVLGRNGGSAGSFKAGLEAAASNGGVDFVVAFDDDAVPAPDCLALLLEAARALPRAGAVGATSRTPDGRLAWGLYVDVDGGLRRVADHDALRAAAAGREAVPVTELAWHALLIPSAVIHELGGPWADLFMWYEDVEYGLRLRAAGRPMYVVPAAAVTHPPPPRTIRRRVFGVSIEGPVTDRRRAYLMVRNSLVVRHRYCGRRFWWVDLPLTLARGLVVALALDGSRLGALRDVMGRGSLDAVRGRLGPPPFEQ